MSYAVTRFNANPAARDEHGDPIPVDNLVQTADKLNLNLDAIKAALDTLEGQQHQLAAGVSYIKTSFVGHADSLDKIDGDTLVGDEMAGVFEGSLPSTLYFATLVANSGATPDPPFVTAPVSNAGPKRWVLGARTRRIWLGETVPTVNDDITTDHVFGDYWFYAGNVWLCLSHAQGAASWKMWLNIGTGPNDAAAGNHTHAAYEQIAHKGQPNGYAGLGGDGKVPTSQLPAIALVNTFPISSQVEMLALNVQTGDVAVRLDLHKSFILMGTDPTQLSHWQELESPPGGVSSVDGRTGTVVLSDLYQALSAKGQANGYPGLNGSGQVIQEPASKGQNSGIASLNSSGKVVQEPASKAQPSGIASLNASSKVNEDPANATATPLASKIPIADTNGKLDGWVTDGKAFAMIVAG